jgi:hypothetical protein
MKAKPIVRVSAAKQLRSAKNIALLDALWESIGRCAPSAHAHGFGELWEFMYRERTYEACDLTCKQLYYQANYNKAAVGAVEVARELRDLVQWIRYDSSILYGVHRTAFRQIERWIAAQNVS